jgi:transcriptional regulator with XRE-family HTH domain
MSTTASYVEIPKEQIVRLAQYIKQYREENDVSQENFAEIFNERKYRLFPGELVGHMTRRRVIDLENLLKEAPRGRVAKVPKCREVEVLADILGRTVDNVLGMSSQPSMSRFDVRDRLEDSQQILATMAQHQSDTKELLAWAEFLPCSLETLEFMEAHHEAIFTHPEDRYQWNKMGSQRWQQLRDIKDKRPWKFTQINFLSDIEEIAYGKEEYTSVPLRLRQGCLDNLVDLLQMPWEIHLIIADDRNDERVQDLKSDLRLYDSVITYDQNATVLRNKLGITFITKRKSHSYYWRGMLEELREVAQFTGTNDVVNLLKHLRQEIS